MGSHCSRLHAVADHHWGIHSWPDWGWWISAATNSSSTVSRASRAIIVVFAHIQKYKTTINHAVALVSSRAVPLLLILCQFVPYVPSEPASHNKGHYHHSHRPATNANERTSFLILHKEPATLFVVVVVVVILLHFSRWCSNLFKCAHNKSPFVLFHSTAAAAAAIREIRNGHWNRKDALLLSLPKNRLIQYPFNSSTLIDLRFTINSFSHRCCAFE